MQYVLFILSGMFIDQYIIFRISGYYLTLKIQWMHIILYYEAFSEYNFGIA